MNFVYFYVLCIIFKSFLCVNVPIQIGLETPVTIVDNSFLSLCIGSGIIKRGFKNPDLRNKKLLALAKALTGNENRAEFYLRIGGSAADHTEFDPTMAILNTTELDELSKFVYTLRWKLIFDLNSLERDKYGSWNPDNAIEFIDYATKKGYFIQYELGNEPDLYPTHLNITVTPEQLAKDFKTLRKILSEKNKKSSNAYWTRYGYFRTIQLFCNIFIKCGGRCP